MKTKFWIVYCINGFNFLEIFISFATFNRFMKRFVAKEPTRNCATKSRSDIWNNQIFVYSRHVGVNFAKDISKIKYNKQIKLFVNEILLQISKDFINPRITQIRIQMAGESKDRAQI